MENQENITSNENPATPENTSLPSTAETFQIPPQLKSGLNNSEACLQASVGAIAIERYDDLWNWANGITKLWQNLPSNDIPSACRDFGDSMSMDGLGDLMVSLGGDNWWEPNLREPLMCNNVDDCRNQCRQTTEGNSDSISDPDFVVWMVDYYSDRTQRPDSCQAYLEANTASQLLSYEPGEIDLEDACNLGGIPSIFCPEASPSTIYLNCKNFLDSESSIESEIYLEAVDRYALTLGDIPSDCVSIIQNQTNLKGPIKEQLDQDLNLAATCIDSGGNCIQVNYEGISNLAETVQCGAALDWPLPLDTVEQRQELARELLLASPWQSEPLPDPCLKVIRQLINDNRLSGFYWQILASSIQD
jgi:hypothetical protein